MVRPAPRILREATTARRSPPPRPRARPRRERLPPRCGGVARLANHGGVAAATSCRRASPHPPPCSGSRAGRAATRRRGDARLPGRGRPWSPPPAARSAAGRGDGPSPLWPFRVAERRPKARRWGSAAPSADLPAAAYRLRIAAEQAPASRARSRHSRLPAAPPASSAGGRRDYLVCAGLCRRHRQRLARRQLLLRRTSVRPSSARGASRTAGRRPAPCSLRSR